VLPHDVENLARFLRRVGGIEIDHPVPLTSRSRIGKSARIFSTSNARRRPYCGIPEGITIWVAVICEPPQATCAGGGGEVTLVALVLQPLRQSAALLDDATADEDMHEVRRHVAQDPGVMGDEQNPGFGRTPARG